MTTSAITKLDPTAGARNPLEERLSRACRAALPSKFEARREFDWVLWERDQGLVDFSQADGLAAVCGLFGRLSLTGTFLGLFFLFVGPFTCFMGWIAAYYVYLVGLPIHFLALNLGWVGHSLQSNLGRDRRFSFAFTSGLLGTLVSGMALVGAYAIFGWCPLFK